MNVADLIAKLQALPKDALVVLFDADDGGIDWYYPLHNPETKTMVKLQNEEIQWNEDYFEASLYARKPGPTGPEETVVVLR